MEGREFIGDGRVRWLGVGRLGGSTLYTLSAVATVALCCPWTQNFHSTAQVLLVTHTTPELRRRQATHTHSRWNRKSFKCLRVRYMQFESFVNYSIPIPFYKFSHVFFSSARYDLYFFVAHTRTHTHSTAGRRCCFSRLVMMACSTSHRIDENDKNDSPAMNSWFCKIEIWIWIKILS